jgi:DNA-binding transcriptional MerR regulator
MQNNKTDFGISELAKEFDITPRTIRHYEDEQLIMPKRQGSQRIYSNRERVKLQLILRGKRLGFSLSEIREIMSLYNANTGETKQRVLLLNKIEQRRKTLKQQQQDIETTLNELNQLEQKLNQ